MKIFLKNQQLVKEHNERFDRGEETFTVAINKFSDRLPEELPKGLSSKMSFKPSLATPFQRDPNFVLPDTVDWRHKGAVTAVKDQGLFCGSCWAFSTTGAIEAHQFIKTGKLVPLSEQNLVDCVLDNMACEGGFMSIAYEYIVQNKGIDREDSYPYIADDQDCQFNGTTVGASIKSYVNVTPGDEQALAEAVAKYGPVSVGISVSSKFQNYREGVMNDLICTHALNHAVLIVGYGMENGTDYWLVKNSWGESWGDKGYIKMSRNKGSQCGIADLGSYPVM